MKFIEERDALIKDFRTKDRTTEECQMLINNLIQLGNKCRVEGNHQIFAALILKNHKRNRDTFYQLLVDEYDEIEMSHKTKLFRINNNTTIQLSFDSLIESDIRSIQLVSDFRGGFINESNERRM